ncbi:hypothetical protein TNCV_5067941 [Trichonephila clavipes]|uniref:Uncharacterized protein n=1 Tax=Trichonephila clavipes TaxID=2585209 RepID=A0A8X6V059_TRICX|nr:hypothetical protein TNCV_5067941 [Trichonephila clavipes]
MVKENRHPIDNRRSLSRKNPVASTSCDNLLMVSYSRRYSVKEKMWQAKRLGRGNEEGGVEFSLRSTEKSTRGATCELEMPQKTVWKIL